MVGWLRDRLRLSALPRSAGSWLFSTPSVVNSPLYRAFERRVIRMRAKRLERRPPRVLHIENTNHCNAACIMCPNPTMSRVKAFMRDDTYSRAISQAAAFGIKTISIVSIGEPLLDKKFVARVREARGFGLRVTTATNGSLLNPRLGEALIEGGLDELHISVDGSTASTFEAIRRGLDFERVISNIEGFLALRHDRRAGVPRVILRYVGLPQNRHEIRMFLERWREGADDVIISHAHDWAGGVPESFRGEFHSKRLRRAPCRLIWEELMVHHDGSVVACCHDYEGTLVLGNILHQTLAEIWRGEPMRKLRQSHLRGDPPLDDTCMKCRINTIWW